MTDNRTLDAKKLMAEYNQRLAWVGNFREALPTILRIGEEMGAPMVESGWDVGLAHLRFNKVERGRHYNLVGDVTKSPPGMRQTAHMLHFRVFSYGSATKTFDERVETPDQLEDVCRRFFAALVDECARLKPFEPSAPTCADVNDVCACPVVAS